MKRLLPLLLALLLCASCSALPAEERAFAVVLGVDRAEGEWTACARIPTYQTGGGYATVKGTGPSLDAALEDLDSAAPMHVNLSQLRLLVLGRALGDSDDLLTALTTLSQRPDMRLQTTVAATDEKLDAVMEAMKPATGSRLSKSIDVLWETRTEQGTVPDAALDVILRMGERQTPVLAALTLTDGAPDLLGGWPVTHDGRLTEALTAEEQQLLSMMQGRADSLTLTLPDGHAQVRDVAPGISLEGTAAHVRMTLRVTASSMTDEQTEVAIAQGCLMLLRRLSASGCDALGLGRNAILGASTMARWHERNWPAAYRALTWSVSVGVRPAA